jgi:hypothetical protein
VLHPPQYPISCVFTPSLPLQGSRDSSALFLCLLEGQAPRFFRGISLGALQQDSTKACGRISLRVVPTHDTPRQRVAPYRAGALIIPPCAFPSCVSEGDFRRFRAVSGATRNRRRSGINRSHSTGDTVPHPAGRRPCRRTQDRLPCWKAPPCAAAQARDSRDTALSTLPTNTPRASSFHLR